MRSQSARYNLLFLFLIAILILIGSITIMIKIMSTKRI